MVRIFGLHQKIDISYKAHPEQLERYATLYNFRYHPQQMEKHPFKSRPDYHKTTQAIVSMNKEAGHITKSMLRNNYREDIIENQKKSMPQKTEKHELIHLTIGGKQRGGTSPGGRSQVGHGVTKSEEFFFFNSGFCTHVVATTVCATGSVRTFSLHFFLA